MIGTIINCVAIIVGGTIGLFLKKGISDAYKKTIMDGVALSVIVIGVMNAIKTENIILLISSLVIGAFIGQAIDIEERLSNVGAKVEKKFNNTSENSFSKGFVTASLIFCIGAMAVVGSIEAGMFGKYETLFAKAILEGITALVFATTMGVGVIFSAIPVFIYQGIITVLASGVGSILTPTVITEISAVGGVLIIGLGITLLELKEIKVGNLLPAIIIPIFYFMITSLLGL